MELVGLEPTTKVLWNMGVSDQPTSSDTRARAQKVLFAGERKIQALKADQNQHGPIAVSRYPPGGIELREHGHHRARR